MKATLLRSLWAPALAGTLLFVCSCGSRKDPAAQPDVLLVLVDGLRADRDGRPGGEDALLAALGDMPRRSFTEAYSQSISPPLSLGSLLTGLYSSAIPMCGFSDFRHEELSSQAWCAGLPAERATLPKALAAYGWRTAFLHPDFLEQAAFAGQFEHDYVFPRGQAPHSTPWEAVEAEALGWWGQSQEPRLMLLQLADPMAGAADGARPGPRRQGAQREPVPASYTQACEDIGQHLAALVARLEQASDRPLLVVLSSPHGMTFQYTHQPGDGVTQQMEPELLEEATLHVPLHLFGSAVQQSASFDAPVELRAVLPTVLARADAALPAGVLALDLLSDDPAAWGEGYAYAEVGDMFTLRKDRWLLRFRVMVDRGSALNPDMTTFMQHPVDPQRPSEDDARFYSLFDPYDRNPHPREHSRHEWATVLALREAMIAVRTGPAAPAPQAMDPAHLLELRMTVSQGYW